MAKAIAKCTCSKCGKEFEVVKNFYSRKEAMSFEEWMESNPSLICPDCRKAIEDAAIDERSAGMPELTGSEKQIAWARKIRLSVIEALDRLAKEELIDAEGNPHAEGLRIYKLAIADLIAEHTDSAWWIENRNAVDVNWFWAVLMNPAIEKHSNTAEEATKTAPRYAVLPEFIDDWYWDASSDEIEQHQRDGFTFDEILELARGWDKTLDELTEQLYEI